VTADKGAGAKIVPPRPLVVWYIMPVLRRVAAVVVLAGLSVGLGLPLLRAARAAKLAGPHAVRLVTPGGKRLTGQWQTWANASLVPTVAGKVVIKLTGCPGLPKAAGCVYTKDPRIVYLRPGMTHPRGVMLHELGHVYDLTVMSNTDRGEFRRIMRRPHAQWWKGKIPLAEWFAEAYSWCARYSKIASVAEYAIYDYDPTPAQHRSTCSLIKRAAHDKTPPKPPSAPPVVTGDPAPPASPPVSPTVVPGNPARDPGPTVLESPMATPAATPTKTPNKTPTATPTRTPTATPTRTPRHTPTPTPTPTPDPTEEPTPEPTEEPTPAPTQTALPTATDTPVATPTETPEVTPTPEPTPEPAPDYRGYPH
jgi:hypothetical protein